VHARHAHEGLVPVVGEPLGAPHAGVVAADDDGHGVVGEERAGRVVAQVGHQQQHLVRHRVHLHGDVPPPYLLHHLGVGRQGVAVTDAGRVQQNGVDQVLVRLPVLV